MNASLTKRARFTACALAALLTALLLGAVATSPAYAGEGKQAKGQGIQSAEVSTLGQVEGILYDDDPIEVSSGEWKKSGSKWWYDFGDGTWAAGDRYLIGGSVYLFDSDGWMLTGWIDDDYTWYYFASSGKQAFGWTKIGGKWYCFAPNDYTGYMMTSWIWDEAVQNYRYLDPQDGYMVTGWIFDGTDWYYLDPANDGLQALGWTKIGGKWYYLDPNPNNGSMVTEWIWDEAVQNYRYCDPYDGYMVTGWLRDEGYWYYLDPANDGLQALGWKKIDGAWYYFAPNPDNGLMSFATVTAIDDSVYAFDKDGEMQTGWFKVDDNWGFDYGWNRYSDWFCSRSDGTLLRDVWQKDSQGWCYLDATTGEMWTNRWKRDSQGWCYIGPNGYCVTGDYMCSNEGEDGHPYGGFCEFDANGRLVSVG